MDKKLHEKFCKKVYNINKSIKIIGIYNGSKSNVDCECLVCGYKWSPVAASLLSGYGCKKCAINNRIEKFKMSQEDFEKRVYDLFGDKFTVLGEYKNKRTDVLLKCNICENTFFKKPDNLRQTKTCPICKGRQLVKGFNDMWTTNPELAKLLVNIEDGYKYTINNYSTYLDWKCLRCGYIFKNKMIGYVKKNGLSCPKCSDGISYPEKFVYSLLQQLNVEFCKEVAFDWSQGKRYDFYIPKLNIILEIHGIQHYEKRFKNRKRSFKEEYQNDIFKKQVAIKNGITNYIIIDAKFSSHDYIKNSILSSQLSQIYDLNKINWELCEINSLKSLIIEACNLWDNGINDVSEISNKLSVCDATVRTYLKKGAKIGLCNYNPETAMYIGRKKGKRVLCVTTGKVFESITEAAKYYHINKGNYISYCCKNKRCYAGKLEDGTRLNWEYID